MTRIARERESYVQSQGPSRRLFLAAGSAAAVFGSLTASAAEGLLKTEALPLELAVPAVAQTAKDPVLIALAEHLKSLRAERAIPADCMDDALVDAVADRCWETRLAVLSTKPTTLAGALQLGWFSTSEIDDNDVHQAMSRVFSFFVSQYGYGN